MEADDVYVVLNRKIKNVQASGGGVTNYGDLDGKPQINGVTLQGNLTAGELGIEEFSGNYQDLQGVPESLPNPHPVTFSGMLPFKFYDGSEPVNITFPDVEILNETAGTPVGEIISYMGTVAPTNYLICDGAEYAISDYPELAQHFLEQFETVNVFGGDGETTFAVPDLRGEFLRGSGRGSRNTGTGAKTGVHQDGTKFPNIYTYSQSGAPTKSTLVRVFKPGVQNHVENPDTSDSKQSRYSDTSTETNSGVSERIVFYTARPTNTAVLYCIKYKPTYFSQVQHTYSLEERRVGTWIDGKPLYEKTVNFGKLPNAQRKAIPLDIEDFDMIWIADGFAYGNNSFQFLSNATPSSESTYVFWISGKEIACVTGMDRSNMTAIITFRYTKTTY